MSMIGEILYPTRAETLQRGVDHLRDYYPRYPSVMKIADACQQMLNQSESVSREEFSRWRGILTKAVSDVNTIQRLNVQGE